MKKFFIFIVLQILLLSCISAAGSKSKKLPVLVGQESQIVLEGLGELSGICLSKNEDFLWGVGDEGKLYRINFDGTFTLEWDKPSEMEGLALNPNTDDIYISLEQASNSAYMIPYTGSGYNFKDKKSFDYKELFAVKDAGTLGNKGIEGIAWYKGELYFGAQREATLYHYTLDGTEISKKSLCNIDGCDIKEIAGLDYDQENDWLWVIDSKRLKLYLFKGDASELLATYDISETAKKNPEGLCIDKKRGCIWVCEDIHKKSLLHRYKFDNLQ